MNDERSSVRSRLAAAQNRVFQGELLPNALSNEKLLLLMTGPGTAEVSTADDGYRERITVSDQPFIGDRMRATPRPTPRETAPSPEKAEQGTKPSEPVQKAAETYPAASTTTPEAPPLTDKPRRRGRPKGSKNKVKPPTPPSAPPPASEDPSDPGEPNLEEPESGKTESKSAEFNWRAVRIPVGKKHLGELLEQQDRQVLAWYHYVWSVMAGRKNPPGVSEETIKEFEEALERACIELEITQNDVPRTQ